MFISPTEPVPIRAIGATSSLPEQYGADILWNSELGMVGVQRKVFPNDFIPSVHDGRLTREYAMMQSLDVAVLLLEGHGAWTTDGTLIREYGSTRWQWTRRAHRNYLASVQMRGIQVQQSDDIYDTLQFISDLREWSEKGGHTGLDTRPKPKGDGWGKLSNKDYLSHLYQSFPSVGAIQAAAIIQHKGVILKPTITEDELREVPGFGVGRARKFFEVFEYEEN